MTILQILNKRKKELRTGLRDKNLKKELKGVTNKKYGGDMWMHYTRDLNTMIDEIDNIIISFKQEGIIPDIKKKKK